jgi:hypothetical protein
MEINFVSTADEAFEYLLGEPASESDGYSAYLPPLPAPSGDEASADLARS